METPISLEQYSPSAASGTGQMKEITPPDGILPLDSPSNGERTSNGREEKWVSVQRRKKGDGKVCVCKSYSDL